MQVPREGEQSSPKQGGSVERLSQAQKGQAYVHFD